MNVASASLDPRFQRILLNAPHEILMQLAASQAGHNLAELAKDKESLLKEVFRVCGNHTITALFDEYPEPPNFAVWFFRFKDPLTQVSFKQALSTNVPQPVRVGITPDLGPDPALYKLEEAESSTVFRLAAKDGKQNLPTSFGVSAPIELVNYYTAIVHFSDPSISLFGPYAHVKAVSVLEKLLSSVAITNGFELLAPGRGGSREFYSKVKKSLKGLLIETKRLDPAGNYKTIAWQAKLKYPDLENVSDFKKYLDADSMYDVLQFKCQNKLGLSETTHVRFGYPFGRFTFKPHTSLSAILHFEERIRAIL